MAAFRCIEPRATSSARISSGFGVTKSFWRIPTARSEPSALDVHHADPSAFQGNPPAHCRARLRRKARTTVQEAAGRERLHGTPSVAHFVRNTSPVNVGGKFNGR